MSLIADLKILGKLARGTRGTNHKERLNNFYDCQADNYDAFREKLLHGRKELFEALTLKEDATLIDMGGGTGRTLDFLGDELTKLRSVHIVDLCGSLLAQTKKRIHERGLHNVNCVEADACNYKAPEPVDAISFSYSLSMIPDWFAAIDCALANLKDDGLIAVVDFYTSRKFSSDRRAQHGRFTRHFLPWWFAHDNVFLRPDLLPYLEQKVETLHLFEEHGKVPYTPFSVPYFVWIGRKKRA